MKIKRQSSPHPNQTPTPEQITYRLIKEYKREALNDKNDRNQVVWWSVQWCRCENVVVEKRRIYVSAKTGLIKTYKQMPWTLEDLKWLQANWAEICKDLQG